MKRRALIIGSETHGLKGVLNDTVKVAELLDGFGFETIIRTNDNATRKGILEGYQHLIDAVTPTDAALVYYSGHGCRAIDSVSGRLVQCIVPTDWTSANEFKGILDHELSSLLTKLTDKTPNVTTIFDCCYADGISRSPQWFIDESAVVKTLAESFRIALAQNAHLTSQNINPTYVEANKTVIRLAATESDRTCFETKLTIGNQTIQMGLLTWALIETLTEINKNQGISWYAVGQRVRELVMAHTPSQRPQLQGPAERLLFSVDQTTHLQALVYCVYDNRPALRAGHLQGVQIGSSFQIMPLASPQNVPDNAIASAKVTEIAGNISFVELNYPPTSKSPPTTGALAYPTNQIYPKVRVKVEDKNNLQSLCILLDQSEWIDVTNSIDSDLFVILNENYISILNQDGVAIYEPIHNTEIEYAKVQRHLEKWARSLRLRRLKPGGLPSHIIKTQFGRVVQGSKVPISSGEQLHAGDLIYLEVETRVPEQIYVAVYDIGVTANVSLLSYGKLRGYKLDNSMPKYTLGEEYGILLGIELFWPTNTPTIHPLRESLVVVFCDDEQSFDLLETPPHYRSQPTENFSAFESILMSMQTEPYRDANQRRAGRYGFAQIDFDLSATPRP